MEVLKYMKFLDKAKALVSSGEVKEGSKNLVEDIC